jgi:anti-sigma factor ChrR (cupin superfamily)
MNSKSGKHDHEHLDSVFLYALQALPLSEIPIVEARISACPDCREEIDTLRPIVDSFVSWPTDVLRPPASLWDRIAKRIAGETGEEPVSLPLQREAKPEWQEAAPGISCKFLATDIEKKRISMLVRLAPGTDYPPHRHGGIEELHVLYGELMIDDKKLGPGDYNRAEADSIDHRVWSDTGCTCLLLTSTEDIIL